MENDKFMLVTVITFGTFDVLHVGHVRLLERAKAMGDRLVVGVSTDAFSIEKKGRPPVYDENARREMILSVRHVDSVFFENAFEDKRKYILENNGDILVMGDDWRAKFDHLGDVCRVVYLPRTPSISTTATIEKIRSS